MQEQYKIRPARSSDAEAVFGLYWEAFTCNGGIDYWRDQFRDEHTLVFVAADAADTVVGFVHARRIIDEAEILAIAVAPSVRRHGLARQLIERLVAELNSAPPCRLFLEVSVENKAAIALYRQAGFQQAGLRKGYYDAPNSAAVDALLLVLGIGP
jgi:ribosomal-protein-alanine N-acetyltransferase